MPLKKRLTDFLDENKVKYVTIVHSQAYTAQELAATLHVPGKAFAKSVILKVDDKYVMAVLPATHKVDMEKLRQALGAKSVSLASEEEFMNLFPKCEVGAMPPFGNLYELPTYMDESLKGEEDIYFNATTHSEVIKMKTDDYLRLVNPTVLNFGVHM